MFCHCDPGCDIERNRDQYVFGHTLSQSERRYHSILHSFHWDFAGKILGYQSQGAFHQNVVKINEATLFLTGINTNLKIGR